MRTAGFKYTAVVRAGGSFASLMLSLLHKKSPFLVLAALLMPDCGAWLYFHPQNTHSFIRLPVNAGSAAKSEACDNTARCWGSTSLRKASADVERPGRRRRRLFCTQPSNDDGPRDEQVRPETRSPPTEDVSSTVVSTVFARLHKPVGLVLAEVEPGKPGLMVDEIVDGGSAEVRVLRLTRNDRSSTPFCQPSSLLCE